MDLAGGRPMGSGEQARRPQRQVAEKALGLVSLRPLPLGLGSWAFDLLAATRQG